MQKLNAVDWIAIVLVIVGGINWGLVGLAQADLVSAIFGPQTLLSKIVYSLIGLASIYLIFLALKLRKESV